MDRVLQTFPRAAIVIDDALVVHQINRRGAILFSYPADVDAAAALTQTLAAGGEESVVTLADELALATARLIRPGDEEAFPWRHQDNHYDVSISRAAEGDAFYVFFLDVTDARMTERIHLDARHYLEAILADIPLALAVLDVRGHVTFANRRMRDLAGRLVGRADLVDLIGAEIGNLAPPETGERWRALCAAAATSDAAIEAERETLLEGELVIATQAQPLHDHRGARNGAILIVEDVTEQARLESELIRMEKLATVGEMVITVNHEINNPLVIISTNAQSLRLLNKELDEKSVKKLERIETQVKRISEVTERLRTMDEVASSEYIADGPAMVDIWGEKKEGEAE